MPRVTKVSPTKVKVCLTFYLKKSIDIPGFYSRSNNNNNNNKSFIFPQISVTMTGIEFLSSDFTGYSVHEHASVNSLGRGSVP
jgi:hypothetical protein